MSLVGKYGGTIMTYLMTDRTYWYEMKEQMKEKYLLIDCKEIMFEYMLQIKQGSMTIDQYTNRFHEFTVRSKILEIEQ